MQRGLPLVADLFSHFRRFVIKIQETDKNIRVAFEIKT